MALNFTIYRQAGYFVQPQDSGKIAPQEKMGAEKSREGIGGVRF